MFSESGECTREREMSLLLFDEERTDIVTASFVMLHVGTCREIQSKKMSEYIDHELS
jgi:hypothetical protein